jgi:HAMP domain-containing protein
MSLLVRMNLAMLLVFAIGASVAGFIAHSILQDNAKREVIDQARLMMESASAVRKYTADEIQPLLAAQLQAEFLPQSIPSYAATQNLDKLRVNHPEYIYREATLNPTNLRDRATDWESDVVEKFRNDANTREVIGERDTATGRALYIAHPLSVTGPQCLVCHSTAAVAPQTMRVKYGDSNGFGWKLHEIIGGQIVSVPLEAALKRADATYRIFLISMTSLFGVLFVVANLLIYLIVVKPIKRITAVAERVSGGDLSVDFDSKGMPKGENNEVAVLARAFERMRRSLERSMALLHQDRG